MEKISVIVPVYQEEKYLKRCIDSLINQTYPHLEIILVNDGSTDGSGQICDEYAEKYPQIQVVHQENQGVSSARNTGLNRAAGDYIGFVDGDDWVAQDMYQHLYGILKDSNSQLSICREVRIRNQRAENPSSEPASFHLYKGNRGLSIFFKERNFFVWNKLYCRTLLEGLSFRKRDTMYEDIYFTYQVMGRARGIMLSTAQKYYYNQDSPGIMRRPLQKEDFILLDIWEQIQEEVQIQSPSFLPAANAHLCQAIFLLISKRTSFGMKGPEARESYQSFLPEGLKSLRANKTVLCRHFFCTFQLRLQLEILCTWYPLFFLARRCYILLRRYLSLGL